MKGEPKSELQLILRRPPTALPVEFQKELRDFYQELRAKGVEAGARSYVNDAVGGGGGLSGEFTVIVSLGTLAIVQARKLIEAIQKLRDGGIPFEIKKGDTTIKGAARDVQKIVPPELLAKLLEGSQQQEKSVKRLDQ
jgi:hypothetical protein